MVPFITACSSSSTRNLLHHRREDCLGSECGVYKDALMGVRNGEPVRGTLLCDFLLRLIFGNSLEGGVLGDPSLCELVKCDDVEALDDADWFGVEGCSSDEAVCCL